MQPLHNQVTTIVSSDSIKKTIRLLKPANNNPKTQNFHLQTTPQKVIKVLKPLPTNISFIFQWFLFLSISERWVRSELHILFYAYTYIHTWVRIYIASLLHIHSNEERSRVEKWENWRGMKWRKKAFFSDIHKYMHRKKDSHRGARKKVKRIFVALTVKKFQHVQCWIQRWKFSFFISAFFI